VDIVNAVQTNEQCASSETKTPGRSRIYWVFYATGLVMSVFALVVGFSQFDDPAWRQLSAMLLVFGLSPLLVAFALTRANDR
jgi:FtsH-binding integral membrane protein